MKQDIKERWTTALRSGEYKQGHYALRKHDENGDTHCCLGVLCDLAVEAGVIPAPELNSGGEYEYQNRSPEGMDRWPEAGVLPNAVYRWAELSEPNPEIAAPEGYLDKYGNPRAFVSLAELNDNGHTFLQIADLIEEHL